MRRFFLAICTLVILAIAAVPLYFLTQNCDPYTRAEIHRMTDMLNEEAALRVPHHSLMSDDMRADNAELIARVDRGEELSPEENVAYRKLGLQNLLENQGNLSILDRNFQAMTDVGMEMENNVGGKGIAGHHDHHDASARDNFREILVELEALKDQNFFMKIFKTTRIYKNTADLMIHMGPAPQSVSVPYQPPAADWPDAELGPLFETFLREMKAVQFAPVNSEAYVTPLHRALDAYGELVYIVQSRVAPELSWAECRLAGNWLSIQHVAPRLDKDMAIRFPRDPI